MSVRPVIPALMVLALALTGCTNTRPAVTPTDAGVESVAFTTTAERVDVVDAATAALVASNFTITLANERLGLLQTDYAPVSGIAAAHADSFSQGPILRELYVRLTINAEPRGDSQLVQIKGTFQRMGVGAAPDRLIGLYWLDQLSGDIAAAVNAPYASRVSQETYDRALTNARLPQPNQQRERLTRTVSAVGIVAAVLFAATLVTGVFAPSSAR